jgi:hypothetical protein
MKWEFKAVSFPKDEKGSTKTLNDLAREGWEYVGPLHSGMVAFRRRRPTAVEEKVGQVRRARTTDAKYSHLSALILEWREAKKEVRHMEDLKEKERTRVLDAIIDAIPEMKGALRTLGIKYEDIAPNKIPYPKEDKDYKHLRNALREVAEAKKELRDVKLVTIEEREAYHTALVSNR